MNPVPLFLASAAAVQQPSPPPPPDSTIVVETRRILPSVGLMNDHMHQARVFMVGVRYQRFDWGRANRERTRALDDMDFMSAGYMMRARHMSMDMVLFDVTYGVTDNLTVTVLPQYVWNGMSMVALDPMSGMMPGDVINETFHHPGDSRQAGLT